MEQTDQPTRMDTALPPALREALDSNRLLIFCGAGISMLPPSCLPSWWGFNQALLEEAKRATLQLLPGLPSEAIEGIHALSLDRIPVQSFSDTLVQTFAGSGYFSVLDVLDSEFPNANHRAIVELAHRRQARAIVSTNFDTLIERSFRDAEVPLRVCVAERDYELSASGEERCTLFKLHGSVTSQSSLIDTVTQKLRGLSPAVRARLKALFRDYHILVLGFSGADLAFGQDYLAFSAINARGPGITWVARPGLPLSEHVEQTVENAGMHGAIVEDELPGFWERLGLAVGPIPGERRDVQVRVEGQARERIQGFFAQPYVGPFSCAALCESLLRKIGDETTAYTLLEALASHPDISGPAAAVTAGVVYRRLATGAMDERDFERASDWSRRELTLYNSMSMFLQENDIAPSPQTLLERANNLAGIWNNIGLCALHQGQHDAADSALGEARRLAEEAHNARFLSTVLYNLAQLAAARDEHPDRVLGLLQTSSAWAVDSGHGQTLYEAGLLEAQTLSSIAEYDGALSALQRARPYAALMGDLRPQVALELAFAQVAMGRGQVDQARERIDHCLRLAAGTPALEAFVRWQFCRLLGGYRPARDEVLRELDRLLEVQSGPAFLTGPAAPGVPSPRGLALFRSAVVSGEVPGDPVSLLWLANREGPEWEIRKQIAILEAGGETQALPQCFYQLCRLKYKEGNPARLRDLAQAYQSAADRTNDRRSRALALNFLGIVHDLLGELAESRRAYQEALSACTDLSPGTQVQIRMNLAIIESKLGEDVQAETLFRNLIQDFIDLDDMDNAVRAMWQLAEHLARRGRLGDAIDQIQVAIQACDGVQNPRARPTLENVLSQWKQRQARTRNGTPDLSQNLKLDLGEWRGTSSLSKEQLAAMREQAQSAEDLGNLGLIASESGHLEEARAFTREAQALYEADGNRLGVSRCWNNLAQIASVEGRWADAVHYAQSALAIHKTIDEPAGQLATLSNISWFCLRDEKYDRAIDHAQQCLIVAKGRRPSRPVAVAWVVLAYANLMLQKRSAALDAAQHLLQLWPSMDAPDLEPFRESAEKLVSTLRRPPAPVQHPSLPPVEAGIEEAQRLQTIGKFDDALSILDLLASADCTIQERARILGTRANTLQSSGRHQEAVVGYRAAADLFRQADLLDLAIRAECQGAVSLRNQGDPAGAESWLRRLLEGLSPGPTRAQVLDTLINTLLKLLAEGQVEARFEPLYMAEIHKLYDQARDMPGVSDESKGLLELNISNVLLWEGNAQGALEKLYLAREHLLRCNSRHLERCEQAIQQVEEYIRE